MAEFCQPEEFQIILAKSPEDYQVYTLAELLPKAFSPKTMADFQIFGEAESEEVERK